MGLTPTLGVDAEKGRLYTESVPPRKKMYGFRRSLESYFLTEHSTYIYIHTNLGSPVGVDVISRANHLLLTSPILQM